MLVYEGFTLLLTVFICFKDRCGGSIFVGSEFVFKVFAGNNISKRGRWEVCVCVCGGGGVEWAAEEAKEGNVCLT